MQVCPAAQQVHAPADEQQANVPAAQWMQRPLVFGQQKHPTKPQPEHALPTPQQVGVYWPGAPTTQTELPAGQTPGAAVVVVVVVVVVVAAPPASIPGEQVPGGRQRELPLE